jgi:tetratricopeptide (TPR) repeat protein
VSGVTGSNIEEAYGHLSEAFEVVKEEKRQFLIPVTLAEVLCYRHGRQQEADDLIDTLLKRFDELSSAESLDANQRALLVRTYLLKGNLAFTANRISDACLFYKKAFCEDQNSAFAHLSFAHAVPPGELDVAKEHWQKGLMLIEGSGAARKREITTRVTALVWGTIAAHKCDQAVSKERYTRELESISQSVRNITYRVPLFFSPLSKQLEELEELKSELLKYIGESVSGSTLNGAC